jgi:hypothetical protein
MTIKKIVAINEIAVEIIPRIFDLIHPLNPSVTRKKKKPETKIKDKVLCKLRNV